MFIDIAYHRFRELNTQANQPDCPRKPFDMWRLVEGIRKGASDGSRDSSGLNAELSLFFAVYNGDTVYHDAVECYSSLSAALSADGYGYYVELVKAKNWRLIIKALALVSVCTYDMSLMAAAFCNIVARMMKDGVFINRGRNEFDFEFEKDEIDEQLAFLTPLSAVFREFETAYEETYKFICDDIECEKRAAPKIGGDFDYFKNKTEYVGTLHKEGNGRINAARSIIDKGLNLYKEKKDNIIGETIGIIANVCCVDPTPISMYVDSKKKLINNYADLLTNAKKILFEPLCRLATNEATAKGLYTIYDESFLIHCRGNDCKKLYSRRINGWQGEGMGGLPSLSLIWESDHEILDIAVIKGISGDCLAISFGNIVERMKIVSLGDNIALKGLAKPILAEHPDRQSVCVTSFGKYLALSNGTDAVCGIVGKPASFADSERHFGALCKIIGDVHSIRFSDLTVAFNEGSIFAGKKDEIVINRGSLKLKIFKPHDAAVSVVRYIDGIMYTCSADGRIRAWKPDGKKRLFTIDAHKPLVGLCVTELYIAVLTDDGEYIFYSRNGLLALAKGAWRLGWLIGLLPKQERKAIGRLLRKPPYRT